MLNFLAAFIKNLYFFDNSVVSCAGCDKRFFTKASKISTLGRSIRLFSKHYLKKRKRSKQKIVCSIFHNMFLNIFVFFFLSHFLFIEIKFSKRK